MGATTGNTFPGTAANVARASNATWSNPGNARADDAADASASVPCAYLVATNYGFAVPTGRRILGVTARVEASETGSGASNYIPQLCSAATPTLIGSATAAVAVSGTTKAISTVGAPVDTWGAALTPAIVNGSGFGLVLWSDDTTNVLAVDYVTLAVEYTASTLSSSGVG